jgi:hypothetical protein
MSETKVGDAKVDGLTRVRKVRRNRKDYGEIRHYPGKVTVYWTKRRLDEYHRLTLGWLIEVDTVAAVKLYSVTHIGLLVEGGAKLLLPITALSFDALKAGSVERKLSNTYVDPWGRRGATCWHIPERLFAKVEPDLHEQTENMLTRMHVKRDRSKKTPQEILNV